MKGGKCTSTGLPKGFSTIELITVVAIIGILAAMAIGPFVQWRKNLQYRKTAMSAVSILRQAKNLAITSNLEQQVVFNPAVKGFGIQAGDRANNSQTWGSATNWTTVPSAVITSSLTIKFAPTGTVTSPGTVQIQDTSGTAHFFVSVTQVGRINVTTP